MIDNDHDDWQWLTTIMDILNIIQDGLEGQELCSNPVDGEKGNEDVNMGERF